VREAQLAEVQDAFWGKCEELLFHHTNPWELDEALVAWGFTRGPCEAQDLIGLDVVRGRQSGPVTPVLSRMLAEGRMGKKGGVGFYRYPGSGGAVIDPLIEDLIREEAWFAKVDRIDLSDLELIALLIAHLRKSAKAMSKANMSTTEIERSLKQVLHFPASKNTVIWDAESLL
jgi:3-hydroxyacyl-CoA dehydrogenase